MLFSLNVLVRFYKDQHGQEMLHIGLVLTLMCLKGSPWPADRLFCRSGRLSALLSPGLC